MAKDKATRLLGQLEKEGLENTHRSISVLHQIVCELVGFETALDIPAKHVPVEARRQTPEGIPSPRSAGESLTEFKGSKDDRVARDSRIQDEDAAVDKDEEMDGGGEDETDDLIVPVKRSSDAPKKVKKAR